MSILSENDPSVPIEAHACCRPIGRDSAARPKACVERTVAVVARERATGRHDLAIALLQNSSSADILDHATRTKTLVERAIDAARAAGAFGAKLAGAGGGGTIVALTDDPDRVGKALLDAGADSLMRPEPRAGLTVVEE